MKPFIDISILFCNNLSYIFNAQLLVLQYVFKSSDECLFQFPPRRDGEEQAGPAERRRQHHIRDAFHHHAGLHDGPALLPAGCAELHRGDREL